MLATLSISGLPILASLWLGNMHVGHFGLQ